MKSKRNNIFIALLIIFSAFILVLTSQHRPLFSKYVYLNGTVTAYDLSPTVLDGGIIFKINDVAVDIGGGLRASEVMGEVYAPITIGDKVEAKVLKNKYGDLTLYDCRECYVRKQ